MRKRERFQGRFGQKTPGVGPVNLDELPVGSSGKVTAITGERALRRRLMEMGLLEGSRLRVVKFAPSGDPIEIQVNDYFLSLRRSEAARIIVMPNGPKETN